MLEAWAIRIADLKRDARFKYMTVFKNQGPTAGEEWPHSHSQVVATTFVPRRILYELRAARDWYRDRERCVFCDILRQEIRQKVRVVDNVGDYYAFCPYASRVPFEMWIMPKTHNHLFEMPSAGENRRHLASLLGRSLRRLLKVTDNYHLVLHTAPNTLQTKGELSDYWRTIAGRLPLAHRDSADRPVADEVLQHQGSLFQRNPSRTGGRAVAPVRSGEIVALRFESSARATARDAQRGGIIFKLLFLICFACFVFVIYLVRHPLLRLAGGFWIVDDGPAYSDAIVILGDDNYGGDRAAEAAEAFQGGLGAASGCERAISASLRLRSRSSRSTT